LEDNLREVEGKKL